MWWTLLLLTMVAIVAAIWHGQKQSARTRTALFDPCLPLLDDARIEIARDGFPILSGRYAEARVSCELIADTLTVRRLPQLWLKVTATVDNAIPAGFGVIRRFNGTEFYALTPDLRVDLPLPDAWPRDAMLRGEALAASAVCAQLDGPVRAVLADPRVKEIAVMPRGLRIVRQVAEGQRGAHLILRQAVFDGVVLAELLAQTCSDLSALRQRLTASATAANTAAR